MDNPSSGTTMRRRGYLQDMQAAGALESEPDARADTNESGLAFYSVTSEAGQRIIELWRINQERTKRHE